jgi:hypothetical protein
METEKIRLLDKEHAAGDNDTSINSSPFTRFKGDLYE